MPRLKAGYYRYAFADARRELAEATTAFHALVRMAAAAGVVLAYHNHSGDYVGAPVWDALRMIEGQPADATGLYFDVRHATVEGGLGGWRAAVQMAAPHLRMLAIKDFYWEKGTNGRWRVVDCPVGDGMVDWKAFGAELRAAKFSGPMSLHVEYDPGGRTTGGEDRTDAGGGGAGPHPPGGAAGRSRGRGSEGRRPLRRDQRFFLVLAAVSSNLPAQRATRAMAAPLRR